MGGGMTKTGGGQQSSTTTNVPWAPEGAALQKGYSAAQSNILDRPTEFYGGQTFAGFAPETEQALTQQTARAGQGPSADLTGAQDYNRDLLSGDMSNPAFAGMADAVTAAVRPGIDASFARAGRGGSPIHNQTMATGITRGMMPFLGAAADRATNLSREELTQDNYNIDRLGDVGRQRQQQEQLGISEDVARFDFGQNEPANRAQSYLSAIQGMPSFGTSSSSGSSRNLANSGMLGGGTLMSMLGGGK